MNKFYSIISVMSCLLFSACSIYTPATPPSGCVYVSDAVPYAILEIRYFSTYNFVGERIDGYEQPTALLTVEAATALKAVSDDLKKQGYRLKIFDAYRPQRAVNHFVAWAKKTEDIRMKPYFYGNL
ncbi:MAG: peptidase M15, partial [Lentisphaeria bacterium]|nr:peptidase M15 [Lentisphaeria bacterium]